ncbi:TPA: hypothetical protein VDW20_001750 [Pseudomonas aeruginosa]|nr:hypothetical protein [Pseudomonas aeruginosa]
MTDRDAVAATVWSSNDLNSPSKSDLESAGISGNKAQLTVGQGSAGTFFIMVAAPFDAIDCPATCEVRTRLGGSDMKRLAFQPKAGGKAITATGREVETLISESESAGPLLLEIPFIKNGRTIMEFDTSGLPWASR